MSTRKNRGVGPPLFFDRGGENIDSDWPRVPGVEITAATLETLELSFLLSFFFLVFSFPLYLLFLPIPCERRDALPFANSFFSTHISFQVRSV